MGGRGSVVVCAALKRDVSCGKKFLYMHWRGTGEHLHERCWRNERKETATCDHLAKCTTKQQVCMFLFIIIHCTDFYIFVLCSSLLISFCSQFSPVLHFTLLCSVCLPALHVVILPLNSNYDLHPSSCFVLNFLVHFHILFLLFVISSLLWFSKLLPLSVCPCPVLHKYFPVSPHYACSICNIQ